MNRRVLCPGQRDEVLDPIVQRVVVDVMNHRAARSRSIHGFPNHHGALSPDIRLGHLHKRPTITVALVPGANALRPNRKSVVSGHTLWELGSWSVSSPLVHAMQRVVERGRTAPGATVRGSQLSRLAGEWRTTDRAGQSDGHVLTLPSFTGTGTTQLDLFGAA